LYLNIETSALGHQTNNRPVLVWIHGGGLTEDAGRDYDATQLVADGIVVVTINYRLGALGFLAHPALTSGQGGSSGNYGWMDQQAALRWVQRNIARFGGNPHDVTIAGESAGGLSVLAQMVSPGGRGLFERAIVESGAFALNQQTLVQAETAGQAFAIKAGCPDQSATCLRSLPVSTLVADFPGAAIPGYVDGKVLTQPIGTALAEGRFTKVPILNGFNHDEEALFVGLGRAVSGGTFVPVSAPVTAQNYSSEIASTLGVSATQAQSVASQYPLASFPSPEVAFSTLVSDASFACPALQVDSWTARYSGTFAYQFDDDSAPLLFVPPGLVDPVATHSSELGYLFDIPNAPYPKPLTLAQQSLADEMRTAWAQFARDGRPHMPAAQWSSFNQSGSALSLVTPGPVQISNSATAHHCSFWDGK
jgi:para-nitrobenzyl esterase